MTFTLWFLVVHNIIVIWLVSIFFSMNTSYVCGKFKCLSDLCPQTNDKRIIIYKYINYKCIEFEKR